MYKHHLFAPRVTTLSCTMRHQACGARWLYGESTSLCKGGCGLSLEGDNAGSRAMCAPSGCKKAQALQSSTKVFPHCRVFAQESRPSRCLSLLSTPPPPRYNSLYCQVKHPTGSAQTQGCGAVPPDAPEFPTAGRAAGPVLCQRDAPAELQPIALLCAPAHPTGLKMLSFMLVQVALTKDRM